MASLAEILKLFLIDLAVIGVVLLALLPLAKYKKATFAVLKRNFVGYFSNPTGYVFLCLFVLLTTGFAFLSHEFFNANMANLDQLNKYLPYILLVFIPAITMSIWSEEKREGTDELLLTIPAGDVDIVLGKYLAAGAIFSASLLYSQLFNFGWLSLLSEGGVDLGLFCATSFGYWLIGMAMLSIAMAASFLTGNLTVAFILGAAFNAPLAVAGLADLLPSATALSGNVGKASMSANFADFGRGVISLPPLVYFVFVTAVGIYLSIVFIGRRHWLDGGRDVAKSDGSARPMGKGVFAIALLNLAFGCMLSLLAVVVARDTVDVWQDSSELVPVLIGVLALLFYAGGIGLLLRAEWGKAINYVLAALTIAIIISLFLAMGEQIDQSNWGILIAMMISIIVLIAFCVLVFMYMQSLLLHYLVRTTCIFTVGIAMSFLATDFLGFVRFDLTDNQTNSLSDRTYELLDDLKLDRTVYVNAYISKDLPEKFVQIKYDLVSMLREIHEKSNKIVVTIDQSMEPLTKEAAQLRDQYGVEARMVPGVSTTGQFTTQPIFLAAVIECGLEKIVVPFFNDAGSIEYELMRSICTVAAASPRKKKKGVKDDDLPTRLTVGIVRTDAHVGGISISDEGDFMLARQMGEIPQQALVGLLEKQYKVFKKVDPAQPIPEGKYDVLLVVQPSSLPQPQLDNVKDAILRGQPTAIFEDPHPANFGRCPGTDDPRLPSPQAMQQMMGRPQFPDPKGNVTELFDLLGIKLVRAKRGEIVEPSRTIPGDTPKLRWRPFTAVVFQNYNPYPKVGSFGDEVVFANRNTNGENANEKAFNPKDPVVSMLQEVAFITPGAIQELTSDDIEQLRRDGQETLKGKLEFTPLVRIRNDTGILAEQRFGGIDQAVSHIKLIEMREFDKEETEDLGKIESEEDVKDFQRRYHSVATEKGKLRTFGKDYVLAARIRETGGLKGADKKDGDGSKDGDKKKPINVIVVSDADLLSSFLITFRDRPVAMEVEYRFQNVAFVLNIIDDLAGDDRFLEIRQRQVNHASLKVIEDQNRRALENMSKELEKYEEKLNEQNRAAALEREAEIKKLRTEVEELEKKTGDINIRARRDAGRKLREILADNEHEKEKNTKELQKQVNKRMDEHRHKLNDQRNSIQNTYKVIAVVIPPIAPLLIAFVVFVRRRLREREGVSKERLRLPNR